MDIFGPDDEFEVMIFFCIVFLFVFMFGMLLNAWYLAVLGVAGMGINVWIYYKRTKDESNNR
jgi:hypothetical protein